MSYYGQTTANSSLMVQSIEQLVYMLANHNRPFLARYMNAEGPSGTKADPAVKNVKHEWNEKKLKSNRDNVLTAIDNSATTLYTSNQYARYIDGQSIIQVDDEYMTVTTAVWGSSKWTLTVVRGFDTSSGGAHSVGAQINIINPGTEGADATRSDADFGVQGYNYTQIFQRELALSGTAQAVTTYGNELKLETHAAELFPEMLQELENALVSGIRYQSGAKRIMGGMYYFCSNGGVNQDSKGNQLDLRTIDNDIAQLVRNGVDPTKLDFACGTAVRQSISDLKAFKTQDPSSQKGIDYNADFIVTPQGYRLEIPPTAAVFNPNEYFIYPKDSIKVKHLRPLATKDLGATGDADKKLLVMESTAEFPGWALGAALRRKNIG